MWIKCQCGKLVKVVCIDPTIQSYYNSTHKCNFVECIVYGIDFVGNKHTLGCYRTEEQLLEVMKAIQMHIDTIEDIRMFPGEYSSGARYSMYEMPREEGGIRYE